MIAKKSTLVILQNILGMLFGFITLKLVALDIGRDEFGRMALGFSVVSLFSFIAGLGYGNAHLKRVSEGKDLAKCVGTFTAIRVATTALMAAAVIISVNAWTFIYPEGLADVDTGIIYAVLVYFIFASLASIPITTFDARAETSKSQISNMVQHPVKLVAVVFVVMTAAEAARTGTDSTTAYRLSIAYYTLSGIVTCLVAWAVFMFYKYPISKPTWPMVKDYTRFAMLTSVSALLGVILLNTDRVLLGFFWSDKVVGEYFGVQSLTNMLQVVPTAVSLLLLPVISHLDVKRERKAMNRLITASERYISMLVAPITFFIFFFSAPIIHLLLSDEWQPAAFTLSFLAIVVFITSQNSIRNALLQAVNRPGLTAWVAIAITGVSVSLNFLFIPGWSWFSPSMTIPGAITPSGDTHVIQLSTHTGAALAAILANLVGFILLRYLSWKHANASIYHGVTVKHVFASIVMMLPLIYLNRIYEMARWYDLILFTLIGLGIYLAVLVLIKGFKKADLDFYLGILNPKAMRDYMKSELGEKDLSVALDHMDEREPKVKSPARRQRRQEEE